MRTLIGVAVLAAALLAPPAHAGTLTSTEHQVFHFGGLTTWQRLTFTAVPGEVNELLVLSPEARVVEVVDTGAAIAIAPSAVFGPAPPDDDPEGCIPAHVTGSLLGDPLAVGVATCLRPGPRPDLVCEIGRMCQSGALPGYADVHVHAGGGDDVIRALDGRRQDIWCGPGTDTVLADARDVLTDCEVRL